MKTFFATFSAILCAAAVIAGVAWFMREQDRDAARHLHHIELLITSAQMTSERLGRNGRIDPKLEQLTEEDPELFAKLTQQSLPNGASVSALRSKYVDSWEDAIAAVRSHAKAAPEWADEYKPSLKWADEMEKRLETVFGNR